MNTGILTSILTNNIGAVLSSPKPPSRKDTSYLDSASNDRTPCATTCQPEESYNNHINSRGNRLGESRQEFRYALREKIRVEEPPNTQYDKKLEEKNQFLGKVSQQEAVQDQPVQNAQNPEQDKNGDSATAKSTTGQELPVLPASLKTVQLDVGPEQTTELISVEEKALQLIVMQTQANLNGVLSGSSNSGITISTPSAEDTNADKGQIPNKAVILTNGLVDQKSEGALIPELVNGNSPALWKRTSDSSKKSAIEADIEAEKKADGGLSYTAGKTGSLTSSGDDSAIDAILKQFTPQQVKVSDGSAESRTMSTSSNSSNSAMDQFGHMFAGNSVQPTITEQSVSADTTKAANGSSLNDLAASVGKQIMESINASLGQGGRQITIHLNPPELGKVSIKFQEQGDQITGLLEVSKAQTRAEIQQALPQIVRDLQDAGIQVKRLEVVLSEPDLSGQQAYKDQSLAAGQDNWYQEQGHQGPANHGTQGNIFSNEWLINANNYAGFGEPQDGLITDSSINMLI